MHFWNNVANPAPGRAVDPADRATQQTDAIKRSPRVGTVEPRSRHGLLDEDVLAALDGRRVADWAAQWLKSQRQPPEAHPLEAELAKIQSALDVLEECPALWWADRLLWRGLRLFCGMRRRRIEEALEKVTH